MTNNWRLASPPPWPTIISKPYLDINSRTTAIQHITLENSEIPLPEEQQPPFTEISVNFDKHILTHVSHDNKAQKIEHIDTYLKEENNTCIQQAMVNMVTFQAHLLYF